MARSYLTAALGTGVVVGYVISRVEAHIELSSIARQIESAPDTIAASTPQHDAVSESVAKIAQVIEEPIDDLERAARRLDERARTADRLGDPKLADLWREQAASLRETLRSRQIVVQTSTQNIH